MSDASLIQNQVAFASVVMDKNLVVNRVNLHCDFNHYNLCMGFVFV